MKVCRQPPDTLRPWVERVAGHIHDPILRLRFLKTVAPADPGRPRRWPLKFWLLAVVVFALGLAVLIFMLTRPPLHPPRRPANAVRRAEPAVPLPAANPHAVTDVWLVEKNGELETYSNGLRIDTRFTIATHHRSYLAFPANGGQPARRTEPAGIVFHTTESPQAPFAPSENGVLKRLGESLLEYVRRRQAYNFLIDRFGRTYRVVTESDAANHSGYSAWADDNWSYINLNESFLGIAFEAVSPGTRWSAQMNPAQVRSAAMLVEWLRGRYHIPASNCVAHAQVSVNPANMLVGMHHDWAAGLPFEELGLPDNYALPLPALWAYGFDCDANFTGRAGGRMQAGIEAARAILARKATAAGLSPLQYRNRLRQRYREMKAAVQQSQREKGESE